MWALLVLSVAASIPAATFQDTPAEPLTTGRLVLLAAEGKAPVAVMTEAFRHSDPQVRAVAARLVASFGASALRDLLQAALAKETDSTAGAELVRALVLLGGTASIPDIEPHARRLGMQARLPIYERIARTQPGEFADQLPGILKDVGPADGRLLEGLVAMVAVVLQRPELAGVYRDAMQGKGSGVRIAGAALPVTERLLPLWVPDLLTSAAASAGCPLSSDAVFGYAQITLLPDGRAKQIAVDAGGLPKACALVLTGLARLTVSDADHLLPADLTQVVVLPFTREYAGCAPPATPVEAAGRGGAGSPQKVRDVRPSYPPDLQKARVQGLIVMDTTINEAGCVQSARVTSSPAVGLSLAALRAVSGWLFAPTVIDGRAAAFRMTVTVSFNVR